MTKLAISQSGKLHWYHWLVITASLVLTISAWYVASARVNEKAEIQFNYQSDQIIALLKERMSKYEDALWSGVATIYVQNNTMDHLQWRQFSEALSIGEKYPGINGIGVIKYVAEDELAAFLAEQTAARPDFRIHPQHQKKEFWPITFIEPIELNIKALGLDMAHERNRLNASKKARDSGRPQVSGPIILVQDKKRTPGFLLFVPFYKQYSKYMTLQERQQHFDGMVYAPFTVLNLMEGTLQNKNRLVNISIEDGGQSLYNELDEKSEDYDATPLYSKLESVDMYGRKWVFELQSSKLFREQQSSRVPGLILIGGLIIDALLLGLFLLLANYNKVAVNIAENTSKELRISEAVRNTTVKSSSTGFAIIDRQANFIEMNDALCEWLGFSREELMSINSLEIFDGKCRGSAEITLEKMLSGEADYIHMERQYRHKDGSLLHGMVSSATVKDGDGYITNVVFHIVDIQKENQYPNDRFEEPARKLRAV